MAVSLLPDPRNRSRLGAVPMYPLVRISLPTLLLLLPGCLTPPSEVGPSGWFRSGGGTTQEFQQDQFTCKASSTETVWMAAGYGARQVTLVNEEYFVACMSELGWEQQPG